MNWYVVNFECQYVALGTAHVWQGEVAAACTSYWAALAAQRLLGGRCRGALADGEMTGRDKLAGELGAYKSFPGCSPENPMPVRRQ